MKFDYDSNNRVWKSACGEYTVWVQARPRDDSSHWAAKFCDEAWLVRTANNKEEAIKVCASHAQMMQQRRYRMRALGDVQRNVLELLRDRGSWRVGCGWVWDNDSGTKRVLDTLTYRGLVTRERNSSYRLTVAGREETEKDSEHE